MTRSSLYSDGFTEARRNGDLFGEAGMLSALHGLAPDVSSQQIVDRLTAAVADFGRQCDEWRCSRARSASERDLRSTTHAAREPSQLQKT